MEDHNADLVTMSDLDDLGNLFEFGDIDLNNIPDLGPAQYGANESQQQQQQQVPPQHHHHGAHPTAPFHDMADPALLPGNAVTGYGAHDQMDLMQGMETGQQYMGQQSNLMANPNDFLTQSMYQPPVSQTHYPKDFQYPSQHGYAPAHHIPPTPNSYEMHGRPANFMSQQATQLDRLQHRALEQQRYQMHKDAAIAFTPMASPAGTPQFHLLPEFTAPGAYFSPLSSPMLRAQNSHPAHMQGYATHPSTAPSSAAPSPNNANMDIDMAADAMHSQELPDRRKSRRKIATPKGPSTTGRVKSSPTQRAQKRKPTAKSSELDLRRAVTSQPSSTSLPRPDSSEAESASPETLSDSVMGPPPRPGSTSAPLLGLSRPQESNVEATGAAATPKSLLQRRSTQQSARSRNGSRQSSPTTELGALDDLALPEAASDRPPMVAPIDTSIITTQDGEDGTPRLSARKTPKFGPSSTPASARVSSSAQASPVIAPSPASASTPAGILKDRKDGKGARGSKKRTISTSGVKNLPKISPSIKPLLPEGSKFTLDH